MSKEQKKYTHCIDTAVVCKFKKANKECKNCLDVTDATNFMRTEMRVKELKGVAANMDYMAYLMQKFRNKNQPPT